MGRKLNLFNFLEKKLSAAELKTLVRSSLDTLAFKELALHIGISYIANALSKCEFRVYEKGKEVHDNFYYLLNVSPNPNESSSQFINHFVENYFYKHGALITLNNDHLYCADHYDLDDSNPLKEFVYENVTFGTHVVKKKYKASEVFNIRLDNKDVVSLVNGVYKSYGDVLDAAIACFKRTNGKKYKLLLDSYKAGDKDFNEQYEKVIKTQLKEFIENDNAIYPQYQGIDLQEFSANTTPGNVSDIVATRKEIFEVTAQALKLPLPMMYGNITSIKDIVQVFLSFCLDPHADAISEELTRKRYSFEEWQKGSYIKVDTSCINHVDLLESADNISKLVSSGAFNIDYVRRLVGEPTLNTDFSQSYFMTKNYALVEDVLKNLEGGGGNE